MAITSKDPAFPRPYVSDDQTAPDSDYKLAQIGMDIRTYIATQIMAALYFDRHSGSPTGNAVQAVEGADALIWELNNEK